MKKKRFAFLLPGQNTKGLSAKVLCFLAFFAFMLLAESTSAQKFLSTDVPIEKIEKKVEDLTEIVSQLPAGMENTQKVQYYQDYLQYMEAVLQDMQGGDTYAEAARKNISLYPEHPLYSNQPDIQRNADSDAKGTSPKTKSGKKPRSVKPKSN